MALHKLGIRVAEVRLPAASSSHHLHQLLAALARMPACPPDATAAVQRRLLRMGHISIQTVSTAAWIQILSS